VLLLLVAAGALYTLSEVPRKVDDGVQKGESVEVIRDKSDGGGGGDLTRSSSLIEDCVEKGTGVVAPLLPLDLIEFLARFLSSLA
jgi:hypothetical protein